MITQMNRLAALNSSKRSSIPTGAAHAPIAYENGPSRATRRVSAAAAKVQNAVTASAQPRARLGRPRAIAGVSAPATRGTNAASGSQCDIIPLP